MNNALTEKISKLLALAESSNVNEAALAMAKARELMDRHNLDMSDIEWNEKQDAEPILKMSLYGHEVYGKYNRRRNTFGTDLMSMLARHNQCRAFGWVGSNGHTVVGSRPDIDMTLNMFQTLYTLIQTECDAQYMREYNQLPRNERWRMKHWKKSFRSGAFWTIDDRLKEMKQDLKEEYAGSTALVRLDQSQLVDQFVEENIETVNTQRTANSGMNRNGLNAGNRFGASVPLNKQLKG